MDGILVVNKPAGITSHDVIDIIRRKMNIKRVGHTGTLDPIATGVLIILMGKATGLSKILVQDEKEYVATLFLGRRTDTQDSAGRVIEEKPLKRRFSYRVILIHINTRDSPSKIILRYFTILMVTKSSNINDKDY